MTSDLRWTIHKALGCRSCWSASWMVRCSSKTRPASWSSRRRCSDELDIGVADTLMAVDLRPGVDLTIAARPTRHAAGNESLSLEPGVLISDPVRNAVSAQARGLWILAAVAAIAAIAVLGQVITRQVRPAQGERERLSAIGFTQAQVLADSVCRAIIPITIGSLARRRAGESRRLATSRSDSYGCWSPIPGSSVDWIVLLGGAVVVHRRSHRLDAGLRSR